jgi:hypothetical protein
MNNNLAYDEKEERRRREAIELCGKNRGPHDYMPIEWNKGDTFEYVTRLMCRVCFCQVRVKNLLKHYPEILVDK